LLALVRKTPLEQKEALVPVQLKQLYNVSSIIQVHPYDDSKKHPVLESYGLDIYDPKLIPGKCPKGYEKLWEMKKAT
jgi:hypothetical protein